MIKINEKREVVIYSINGTMNENNTIELIFDIPQKYEENTYYFVTAD